MSNLHMSQSDRITALEVTVTHLLTEQQEMNGKLDQLLGLSNKGIGAFWLVSALAGTGLIGLSLNVLDWLKGLIHG